LLRVGGVATVIIAVAVFPVPPLVEVTAPVVLVFGPTVVPVTVTLNTQVPLPTMVAPVNVMVLGLVVVSEPPQVVVGPDVATVNPPGNVSVNPTPVSASAVLGFVIVNVSVEVPLSAIIVGLNALLIDGGATTVMLAVLLVAPVPPSVEVIAPVVLLCTPAVAPVTVTLNTQVPPPAATVAPLSVIVPGAVVVSVPPQVTVGPEVATVNPAGSVSVNPTPVSTVAAFGFVIVNVRVVVPPSGMVAAPNALLIVGGLTTVKTAVLLGEPVPPSTESTPLVVLLFGPAVVPVTLTVSVQEAPGASVPPPKFSVVSPGVAFHVPVQVAPMPAGFATCNPAGKLSEKPMPVRVATVFGLVSVRVSVVTPLSGIEDTPNALVIVTGSTAASVHSENDVTPASVTALLAVSTAPVRPCAVHTEPIFFHSASFVSVLPFNSASR
jgi:hypothetical protein